MIKAPCIHSCVYHPFWSISHPTYRVFPKRLSSCKYCKNMYHYTSCHHLCENMQEKFPPGLSELELHASHLCNHSVLILQTYWIALLLMCPLAGCRKTAGVSEASLSLALTYLWYSKPWPSFLIFKLILICCVECIWETILHSFEKSRVLTSEWNCRVRLEETKAKNAFWGGKISLGANVFLWLLSWSTRWWNLGPGPFLPTCKCVFE